MKSILVHFASLAVVIHMTFGCNWHHGFGFTDGCSHQSALSCCPTESNCSDTESAHDPDHHDHGDHDHDSDAAQNTSFDGSDSEHNPSHSCCQGDGCNLIKVVKFAYSPLEFWTAYLGGAEDSAIAQASANGQEVDPFPDCGFPAPKVRAHLLYGVQLI